MLHKSPSILGLAFLKSDILLISWKQIYLGEIYEYKVEIKFHISSVNFKSLILSINKVVITEKHCFEKIYAVAAV